MNKQELASRIWNIADDLRGSMEASEYKDYILGFIFYKYLSDNEYEYLIGENYTEKDIEKISEENTREVKWIQDNIGYFIAPENLFQTWVNMGNKFTIDNVMTALSAFQRNINDSAQHQKVFGGIFQTLESGLSNLGNTAKQQTKQVRDLVNLIKDIPTTNDEYDVLGYIYEYLISHFAAGAGKKAGEFYTPNEVSQFMSAVVADHLKDRETIKVYDPTSGSGSLLINIGQAFELHQDGKDNVKYYAQDNIRSTEVLTRMNLLMRRVRPSNIVSRNGDSLERDFPYFDERDPEGTYEFTSVDAVVSNPPYSQKWDPTDKENDPRFSSYGVAPRSKADYAFLLYGLYHLKSDGIMAIVLPHGVLFRGGEEGKIRQNLVNRNRIDAIIGLPANIFFGTGIPTIVMILKKERDNTDILFVDGSKGFKKEGSKNVLQASDIKRLSDTVINRVEIDKYSHLASLNEIKANDYNLNIPRYVDSSEEEETWDIYSTVNGGIPKNELKQFNDIFKVMPELYDDLFNDINEEYVELKTNDVDDLLKNSKSVDIFKNKYKNEFFGFGDSLDALLIGHAEAIHPERAKDDVVDKLFDRFEQIPLIDRYEAYQIFDDVWTDITNDIEVIQRDSFDEAVRAVDPNMVIKKRNGIDTEIQEGWKGRIIPFELVQETLLKEEVDYLNDLETRQVEIGEELNSIIESLSEEEGEYSVLNDANDKFLVTETRNALNDLFKDIESPELNTLAEYKALSDSKASKNELLEFMDNNTNIRWNDMALKKDGTPLAKGLRDYQSYLQESYKFPEDTFGAKLLKATSLMDEEKENKKEIKEKEEELHKLTKERIENLSDKEVMDLLYGKWIKPIEDGIDELVNQLFNDLKSELTNLNDKYAKTMHDIQEDIDKSNQELIKMMDQLTGSEADMKGIKAFQDLLGGE